MISIDYVGSIIYHTSLAIANTEVTGIPSVQAYLRLDCMCSPLLGRDGLMVKGPSYIGLGKDTQVGSIVLRPRVSSLFVTDTTRRHALTDHHV